MLKELMAELKAKREELETKAEEMTEVEVKEIKESITKLEVKISEFIETEMRRTDEMEKKLNSPEYKARENGGNNQEELEIKEFEQFLSGEEGLEFKALNLSKGKVLIPTKIVLDMDSTVAEAVYVERNANVINGITGKIDSISMEEVDEPEFKEDGSIAEHVDPFSKKSYEPQALTKTVLISRDLIKNAGDNVAKIVQSKYISAITEGKEKAYLVGEGVSGPTGIFKTAGVEKVYYGSTTITATIEDSLTALAYKLKPKFRRDAAYVMNTEIKSKLANLRHSVSGLKLFPKLDGADPNINGIPVFESIFAPVDEVAIYSKKRYHITKGEGLSVTVLNEAFAKDRQVGYMFEEYVDGGMARKDAVAILVVDVDPEEG